MEQPESVMLKTGWMEKEGAVRKSWKKRFFVLQGGKLLGRLDYYTKGDENSVEDKNWKGALSLTNADLAMTPTEDYVEFPRKGVRGGYLFCVRTPKRNWMFCAATHEERTEWIGAINYVISHLKDPRRNPLSSYFRGVKDENLDYAPENENSILESAEFGSDYKKIDPVADRKRHELLKAQLPVFVQKERTLRSESPDSVPPGRIIHPGQHALSSFLSDPEMANSAKPTSPARVSTSSVALSTLLAEWGDALLALAQDSLQNGRNDFIVDGRLLLGFQIPVSLKKGNEDENMAMQRLCDARYMLLCFSEAFDKMVGSVNRLNPTPESIEKCKAVLLAWINFQLSISSEAKDITSIETLGWALHPFIGAESSMRVLLPEMIEDIANWTVPALVPPNAPYFLMNRKLMTQQVMERRFILRHIEPLLNFGAVRFGFVTVSEPTSDAEDFARMSGRAPTIENYPGKLRRGRVFCELTDDSLWFTQTTIHKEDGQPISEAEVKFTDQSPVIVPLLWIRKLEIETSRGCYMKFSRYLTRPSAEAQLESRVIYGDNSADTFAWIADITRVFTEKRKNG